MDLGIVCHVGGCREERVQVRARHRQQPRRVSVLYKCPNSNLLNLANENIFFRRLGSRVLFGNF